MYRLLARAMVARSPVSLTGLRVLDVGAGTGAASAAVAQAGGACVALDLEPDMVVRALHLGIPSVVGDSGALPFPASAFDAAVCAFSLSHYRRPADALAEMARVVVGGGPVLAVGFCTETATDPVKVAVNNVALAHGWMPPPWYRGLKDVVEPVVGRPGPLAATATAAGLIAVTVSIDRVGTGCTTPEDIVALRLGMVHQATWYAGLSFAERTDVVGEAEEAVSVALAPLCRSSGWEVDLLILSALSPMRQACKRRPSTRQFDLHQKGESSDT